MHRPSLFGILNSKHCIRFAALLVLWLSATIVHAADRPNVVWIMSEDNSADYLQHFDPAGAPTPNIEAMAEHGITFNHAFSNAPVCSVARTTLITSCYAPRIGTQFHRRDTVAPMPDGVRMFPAYLRDAGYYTTNQRKEDYNAVKADDVWDASSPKAHWKNRPDKSMPFFHVQTYGDSHESSLHFPAKAMEQAPETDPASVKLQPYFPDTPIFRFTRARYHDRIMQIDQLVGKLLEELEADGELENTFVFYFGDHGGVLPRSKGYLYESGLHVPLVIRVPAKFQGLARRELGSRTDGFVEFVDFGPTVLALAGLERPEGIDGRAFLGKNVDADEVDQRNETFGYADRFDEKYDLVRSLRVGKWKYIRNFEPFLPDALQNNYRYKMLAYQEWRDLYKAGKLNDVQSQFFRAKPAEALYDLDSDPYEINNLADDPQYQEQLELLRRKLRDRLVSMPDLSFFTEAVVVSEAIKNPVVFGQQNHAQLLAMIDTVNLALLPPEDAEIQLAAALQHEDPWVRYWALVACSSHGKAVASLAPRAQELLLDIEPLVVVRAIEFLAMVSDIDTMPYLYRSFERATNEPEALRMVNSAVYLRDLYGDRFPIDPKRLQFAAILDRRKNSELDRRLDYLSGKP
ncbi:sulfatase-like hydrolase/transferase [Stieleria varia]|nr:sulfatase-like hydrolase/transferase [Stieleria varia]